MECADLRLSLFPGCRSGFGHGLAYQYGLRSFRPRFGGMLGPIFGDLGPILEVSRDQDGPKSEKDGLQKRSPWLSGAVLDAVLHVSIV